MIKKRKNIKNMKVIVECGKFNGEGIKYNENKNEIVQFQYEEGKLVIDNNLYIFCFYYY